MDRRDPDPGSRPELKASESKASESKASESRAWQTVRHALGRLFSRIGVHRVEDAERVIVAPVRQADLAPPPPALGPNDGWKPTVSVRLVTAPQAATGLRESNLLPSVTLVRGDYALDSLGLQAMPIASADTISVECLALDWPLEVIRLPDEFVRLPASPVRIGGAGVMIPAPKTAPLRGWQVPLPSVTLLRVPRTADPRVRWGADSVLRRMPLTRYGRTPTVEDASSEFSAARSRLAETVHLRTDEITLLGVYPDVPILAVERIMVEDEGRQLRLWIKPEALRGRTAAHRITLLVGRQTSTGKMLQAAL